MTIYKAAVISSILLSSLFMAPATFAQSPSSSASPMQRRSEERQELRQEVKAEKKELKTQIETKLQEFRSNVAENHANRLEKRFNAYYSRLSNIGTRLQSRITELNSTGKDTANAQLKLTQALTTLESAKTKGAESVSAFRAIDPAKFSEQRDKAFAARDLAEAARKLFKQATEELKVATKEVKTLSKPVPSASN